MAYTNHFLLRVPFFFHLLIFFISINQEKNYWIPKNVWLISKIRFAQLIKITAQTFSELRALKTEFMTPSSCPQEGHSKKKKKALYFSGTPFSPNILLLLILTDLLVLTSLGDCPSVLNQPLMSHHPLKASVATKNLNNSSECLFPNIFCVPLKRLTTLEGSWEIQKSPFCRQTWSNAWCQII